MPPPSIDHLQHIPALNGKSIPAQARAEDATDADRYANYPADGPRFPRMSQRETLRNLVKQYGTKKSVLIAKYAEAERCGEVLRGSNKNFLTAEAYAAYLIADAEKKGWVKELKRSY